MLVTETSSSETVEWRPEFPGQRPPFAPGNTLAMKSGYSSRRVTDPIANELVDAVLADDDVVHLRRPAFRPAVVAWANAEARLAVYEQWIEGLSMEQRLESGQGRTSPEEQLRRLDANALTHRSRLGLDPLSAARLGKDVAQGKAADTARVMAELHLAAQREEQA